MVTWPLSEIQRKVRQVTGRYSTQEMTNARLLDYINQYFHYTFPLELKLDRFHTFYEFLTEANVQKYTFPSGYVNFEPEVTVDYLNLLYYQDPDSFYEQNPPLVTRTQAATGDGATTIFTGTGTNIPILPGTLVLTDEVEVFQDTNTTWTTADVNIAGTLGGSMTINYVTGDYTATFNTAPPDGNILWLSYINFVSGTPTAILSYNNQFTFYPVPDTAYRVKMKAYANSLVIDTNGDTNPFFVDPTDRPLLDEWGPTIAYGTARDIFSDYGELDAYSDTTVLYKEQLAYSLRRTNQNLLNERATPKF